MEQQQITNITKQMKQALSEQVLLKLGEETGQCRRQRKVTPMRLALSLLQSMGSGRVETIADLRRDFNRLHGEEVQYKPFHNQLAKRSFPDFMRKLCANLMNTLADKVLGFKADSPFARFRAIYLHDGSSFALKDSLQKSFPGRFTKISPAAVELHVTMELLSEMPDTISLAADSESEVHFVPQASDMKGALFMGDRMFCIKSYLADIEQQGGCYIVRAKGSLNPTVRHAWREDGSEIMHWRDRPLKSLRKAMVREKAVDLDVRWAGTQELDARLIVTWDKENKRLRYLVSNLPRADFSLEQVGDAYRLRWQVELLFKEWKSYANLHAFDTSNASLAEGLIWASICAAILKRFLAHATERVFRVAISTRNVAMSVRGLLFELFDAMMGSTRRLKIALTDALAFLASNAQRSHPKRDQLCGRAKLGLRSEYAAA
ncbi:MAG: IS4 family transposase [Chromatiales bacterium]|nr:IS4 family transposase [Chromatiales bacterium]